MLVGILFSMACGKSAPLLVRDAGAGADAGVLVDDAPGSGGVETSAAGGNKDSLAAGEPSGQDSRDTFGSTRDGADSGGSRLADGRTGGNSGSDTRPEGDGAGNDTRDLMNDGGPAGSGGSGTGGIVPDAAASGGSGTGGIVRDGGAAGNGGSGGIGSGGLAGACGDAGLVETGDGAVAAAVLGQTCALSGLLACNGTKQKQTLICNQGYWQGLSVCGASQNCDSSTGVCSEILDGCVGHDPGFSYCVGDTLESCGPDLVTTTSTACCGNCQSGTCQTVSCGDGKVQTGEECDDGNTTPADGCEPDCKISRIVALAAGATHTCALFAEGDVRCWGGNSKGQLGLATAADFSTQTPYQHGIAKLGAPAMAIAAGGQHTCALMLDNSIRCWGANDFGQLGLGHTNPIGDDESPDAASATVNLGIKVKAISAGGNVTCAVVEDDSVRCWGRNNYGQLGLGHSRNIGDDEQPTGTTAEVILDDGVLAVSPGGDHTCAIMKTHPIWVRCWGRNDLGQLGLGRTDNIGDDEAPTAVPAIHFLDLGVFVSIDAGETRTFALLDNGGMRGWGDNSDAGLGLGITEAKPLNKATDWGNFSFSNPVQEFSVGGLHTCIRLQDHRLRCWGINDDAQLGTGDTMLIGDFEPISYFPPVDLGTNPDGSASYATALAAGARHTCVLLNTGWVSCWGYNADGQLGLGYASTDPNQPFVGGTTVTVPGKLPRVEVFSADN